MTESTPTGRADEGASLRSGIATILATGALLGLAYNGLLVRAGSKTALPWIREEVVLGNLEDVQGGSPNTAQTPSSTGAPATAPAAAEDPTMSDPMGLGQAAVQNDLPQIPDIGRPLQMQLPAVKKFFDAGAAVIIDARTPDEYADGHIPGAINLPYDSAVTDPARLESFDSQGKPIIVYCGGGTCEVSMNLAFAMIQAGQKKLLVYMGGWPEWQSAGYPVAKGAEAGSAGGR